MRSCKVKWKRHSMRCCSLKRLYECNTTVSQKNKSRPHQLTPRIACVLSDLMKRLHFLVYRMRTQSKFCTPEKDTDFQRERLFTRNQPTPSTWAALLNCSLHRHSYWIHLQCHFQDVSFLHQQVDGRTVNSKGKEEKKKKKVSGVGRAYSIY